jgi:hypothetical protein
MAKTFEEWCKDTYSVDVGVLKREYEKWAYSVDYPPFDPSVLVGVHQALATDYLPAGSKYHIQRVQHIEPGQVVTIGRCIGRIWIETDRNNIITSASY